MIFLLMRLIFVVLCHFHTLLFLRKRYAIATLQAKSVCLKTTVYNFPIPLRLLSCDNAEIKSKTTVKECAVFTREATDVPGKSSYWPQQHAVLEIEYLNSNIERYLNMKHNEYSFNLLD